MTNFLVSSRYISTILIAVVFFKGQSSKEFLSKAKCLEMALQTRLDRSSLSSSQEVTSFASFPN